MEFELQNHLNISQTSSLMVCLRISYSNPVMQIKTVSDSGDERTGDGQGMCKLLEFKSEGELERFDLYQDLDPLHSPAVFQEVGFTHPDRIRTLQQTQGLVRGPVRHPPSFTGVFHTC